MKPLDREKVLQLAQQCTVSIYSDDSAAFSADELEQFASLIRAEAYAEGRKSLAEEVPVMAITVSFSCLQDRLTESDSLAEANSFDDRELWTVNSAAIRKHIGALESFLHTLSQIKEGK